MLMIATHMYSNHLMTLASPAGENLRMSDTLWPPKKPGTYRGATYSKLWSQLGPTCKKIDQ